MTQQFDEFWVKVSNKEDFEMAVSVLVHHGYTSWFAGDSYGNCRDCCWIHAWGDGDFTTEVYSCQVPEGITEYTYPEFMAQYSNTGRDNTRQKEQQPMSTQEQSITLPSGVSIVYKDKQGNTHNTLEGAVEANNLYNAIDGFIESISLNDLSVLYFRLGGRQPAAAMSEWLLDNKNTVLKLYGVSIEN